MKIPSNYKKDIPLVFYGAGVTAGYICESFKEHGVKAVCFADGDKNKQGKPPYYDSDLLTYSIDEVKTLYPKFQIFVTTFSIVKFSIIDFLINKANVNKQDILNYEPYMKRLSCRFLEGSFAFHQDEIKCCCQGNKTNPPKAFRGENQIERLEELLELKKETILGLQSGTNKFCKDCSYIQEIWTSQKPSFIYDINLNTCSKSLCNFNCSYCFYLSKKNIQNTQALSKYSIELIECFEYMERKGMISPENTTIHLGDGEITINPHKKQIFAFVSKYNSQIFTNASIYSEEIAELLSLNKTRINVSVDAGTKETFAKIKGRNVFDEVSNNLIQYGKTHGRIVLKYIFIPGVNDNEKDLNGFLRLFSEVGAELINISLDFNYDYSKLENSELFSTILNFADKGRKAGFLVLATDMGAFKKEEIDIINGNL